MPKRRKSADEWRLLEEVKYFVYPYEQKEKVTILYCTHFFFFCIKYGCLHKPRNDRGIGVV